MTTFVLVRHGQTEWNRVERFRGRMDLPLNETGHRQAQAVAEWLRENCPVQAVYTSPLIRATDTAAPIARALGLEPRVLPGLIDIDYGQWQGKTPEEMRQEYPELHRLWYSEPQRVQIPGGESLAQVRERAAAALQWAVQQHPEERVALVTHQVACKVLLCHVLGLDNGAFWRIQQDNGAVNIFAWRNDAFVVGLINHTCHLEQSQLGGL